MTFEWDESKNKLNIEQHKVSFETAQNAFNDNKRILYADDKHSNAEKRFFCIGNDGDGIVTVRFTIRARNVRILGAGYWRRGRRMYEEKNNLR